jgi:hypothetical protein
MKEDTKKIPMNFLILKIQMRHLIKMKSLYLHFHLLKTSKLMFLSRINKRTCLVVTLLNILMILYSMTLEVKKH